MDKPMKFVALAAVLGCFPPATVTATFWGDWGPVDFCPFGEWAVGFSLKTEKPQGDGDDTALNGIALRCSGGSRISSTQGPWGEWGSEFLCPPESRLTSCQLRVEPKQGTERDDTSANNLNCKCNTGEELLGDGASQGDWVAWINCPRGIVTIQTRVEGKQEGGDDTALNDFRFTCWENRPMV